MGRKPKRARRAPAIVPRFLKSVVTVGAIPSLAAACHKQPAPRAQPVVAYYSQPPPPAVAAYAPDAGPAVKSPLVQPVVAAYVHREPPIRPDAAVDAPSALGPTPNDTLVPPPPVVAAYVPRDPPPPIEPPKTKPKPKKKP